MASSPMVRQHSRKGWEEIPDWSFLPRERYGNLILLCSAEGREREREEVGEKESDLIARVWSDHVLERMSHRCRPKTEPPSPTSTHRC